jgi:hypothetical protein
MVILQRIGLAAIVALSLVAGTMVTPAAVSACSQYVSGYYRSNGTYVSGYSRTCADSTVTNNYSYPGNYNPNTGRVTSGYSGYSSSWPSYSSPSSCYYSSWYGRYIC